MRRVIGILAMSLFCLPAQAASFDCAKASTHTEKLICGDPAISKLDEELSRLYQGALARADTGQKSQLAIQQRHWLKHTRNPCKDEACLKVAYWSRQAELATYFDAKVPLYKHESEKAVAIKEVLVTAQLSPAEYNSDKRFCNRLFDDLKQMKGIRFIDPVAQAQSYEDPVLDKWKRQCGGKPTLNFSYGCTKQVIDTIHSYVDAINITGDCYKGFGTPPFKIFELPSTKPGGQKRYFIAASSSYGSAVWEDSDVFPPGHWERVKPRVGGGGGIGTQQFDPKTCEHMGASFIGGPGNHNKIIEYKSQYYFMTIYRDHIVASDGNFSRWVLDAETVAPNGSKGKQSCSWSSVSKLDSSTEGRK